MGRCVDYVENTLDYAEISTVNKIIIDIVKPFECTEQLWNEKPKSLAFVCLIFLWYKLLTGISAFAQFFYSTLAHFGAGIFCRLQAVHVGWNDRLVYLRGQCKIQTADCLRTIVFRKQWDFCCHVLICMVKTIVCSLRFTLTVIWVEVE